MRLEPPREAAHLLHRAPTRRERTEGVEEFVGVVKLARCEEVEYGPELSNVVLEGRAGKDELPTGAHLVQLLQYPRVTILEAVALVHDEVCPADAAQRCRLRHHHLKRREYHVELVTIPASSRLAARARHARRRTVPHARRRAAGRPAAHAARDLARLRSLPIVLQDHLTCLGVAVVRHHVPMRG